MSLLCSTISYVPIFHASKCQYFLVFLQIKVKLQDPKPLTEVVRLYTDSSKLISILEWCQFQKRCLLSYMIAQFE